MDRLARWLEHAGWRGWQVGGVAVAVYVGWLLFQKLLLLVVTVFAAVLMAAFLLPIARWIERRGMSRTAATATSVLGSVLVVAGALTFIVMRISSQTSQLASQFKNVRTDLAQTLQQSPLGISAYAVNRPVDQLGSAVTSHGTEVAKQLLGVLGVLGALVTALVVAFFLVRDGDRIAQWLLDHLVDPDQRDRVEAAGSRAGDTLRAYIQAVVLIGGLDALFIGIALVVLGVPLAVPLAVLTFVGGFFPVVGATVAGFLAALVALAGGGPVHALIVVGVVIAVQQVDGNVLQPVIMGRAIHLHPVAVLLALTTGGLLAGIVGAFLAVPVTAVATAVVDELWIGSPEGIAAG